MNLIELPDADLRQLRAQVGEAAQERIDRILAERAAPVEKAKEPRRGRQNKWEAEYGALLRARPDVVRCEFEAVKLRLADNTWYTPDWWVICEDGHEELIEVKGHWRSRDRVRTKVAARLYGWRFSFVAARKRKKAEGGGWHHEHFRGE